MIHFDPPQAGIKEENVLYSYLYRMSEKLNLALRELSPQAIERTITEITRKSEEGQGKSRERAIHETYRQLKGLITSTANTVREEMDVLEEGLKGEYLAISDFGTYQEQMSADMVATARDVVLGYGYDAKLSTVDNKADQLAASLSSLNAAFQKLDTYNTHTEQYIKAGLLYFDENNIPRYGVAVGENLTTIVQNGQEVLRREGLAATFTSDRMSFWQNGIEVAYVSNNKLYIRVVEILERLGIGKWVIETKHNRWTLRYIG